MVRTAGSAADAMVANDVAAATVVAAALGGRPLPCPMFPAVALIIEKT